MRDLHKDTCQLRKDKRESKIGGLSENLPRGHLNLQILQKYLGECPQDLSVKMRYLPGTKFHSHI